MGLTNWETKDSGEREEYESGMRRDKQEGKPDFSLCVPENHPYDEQMLTRWAGLMTRGAEKYGTRNWELANSVEEFQRFKASAYRHFIQWLSGETDEDHAAAVFFNVTAAEFVKYKLNQEPPELPTPDLIASKRVTQPRLQVPQNANRLGYRSWTE